MRCRDLSRSCTGIVARAILRRHAELVDLKPSFTVLDTDESLFERILDVNLKGTYLASRAVLPHMIRAGGGAIVNIGGLTAHTGAAERVHVVTAKAGLVGLTRALARRGCLRQHPECPMHSLGGKQYLRCRGLDFGFPAAAMDAARLGRPDRRGERL